MPKTKKDNTDKDMVKLADLTELAKLTPHPRNYRDHPESQIDHLTHSITENGFYRPIVTAKEYTILAGHGVAIAATRLEMEMVPVIRLDLDPLSPKALKILAGDNEMGRLAIGDDLALTNLLLEVQGADDVFGLLGTGFTDDTLATLSAMTLPPDDETDYDATSEWDGMPEFTQNDATAHRSLLVHLKTQEDVESFCKLCGFKLSDKTKFVWWPHEEWAKVADKRVVSDTKIEPADELKGELADELKEESDEG